MDNKVFQEVFDMLQPFLPHDWNKMVLFIGYTTGSYSMKFYTYNSVGKYIDCFSQEGVSKAKLIQLFMAIDKRLSKDRKELDDKNKWSVMTMIVNADGSMKTEFDYADISENFIGYEQKWKEKYLSLDYSR